MTGSDQPESGGTAARLPNCPGSQKLIPALVRPRRRQSDHERRANPQGEHRPQANAARAGRAALAASPGLTAASGRLFDASRRIKRVSITRRHRPGSAPRSQYRGPEGNSSIGLWSYAKEIRGATECPRGGERPLDVRQAGRRVTDRRSTTAGRPAARPDERHHSERDDHGTDSDRQDRRPPAAPPRPDLP